MFEVSVRNVMDLRKDEVSALVTDVDENRITENLVGISGKMRSAHL